MKTVDNVVALKICAFVILHGSIAAWVDLDDSHFPNLFSAHWTASQSTPKMISEPKPVFQNNEHSVMESKGSALGDETKNKNAAERADGWKRWPSDWRVNKTISLPDEMPDELNTEIYINPGDVLLQNNPSGFTAYSFNSEIDSVEIWEGNAEFGKKYIDGQKFPDDIRGARQSRIRLKQGYSSMLYHITFRKTLNDQQYFDLGWKLWPDDLAPDKVMSTNDESINNKLGEFWLTRSTVIQLDIPAGYHLETANEDAMYVEAYYGNKRFCHESSPYLKVPGTMPGPFFVRLRVKFGQSYKIVHFGILKN